MAAWATTQMRTAFETVMSAAGDGRNSSRAIGYARLAFRETALSRKIPQSLPMRQLLAALPEPSSSPARIGELLALRCQDIDPEHGFLQVRRAV
jgi:hypothetical protein